MIRLNRNNPSEFIIEKNDLKMMLEDSTSHSQKENRILLHAMQNILSYERENQVELFNIRVEKESNLGHILFQRAREEIIEGNASEIVFSLMLNIVMNPDDSLFEHVEDTLRKQEKNPSKEMIEQILLSRPNCYTNKEDSPLCIKKKSKVLEIISKNRGNK